jgi:hypothetical protein
MPCLVNHVIDVIVSHYMHYIGLHVVLKVITCLLLVHPERLQALYAQYMQCQVVFLLPNEALLTQTSPATAHLVPLPRSNSSQQLICQQLRCLEALRQVQEFTRPNSRAPEFLGHFGDQTQGIGAQKTPIWIAGGVHIQGTGCSGIFSCPHPLAS